MSSNEQQEVSNLYRHVRYQPRKTVVLQAAEGDLLEVDKAVLVKYSAFFRDLFAIPQPPNRDPAGHDYQPGDETDSAKDGVESKPAALELDVPSKDLGMFLDLLHFAQYSELFDFRYIAKGISYIQPMLLLSDKFDVELIRQGLTRRLHALAPSNPWGVLKVASDRDDVALGKIAIGCLTSKHVHNAPTTLNTYNHNHTAPSVDCHADNLFRQSISKIQPLWQLELLNQLVMHRFGSTNGLHVTEIDQDFKSVASRFNPSRYKTD